MNDNDVYFLSETVEIPLTTDPRQNEIPDPRQSRKFCLEVHERKKKFLSLTTLSHKLLKAETDEVDHTPTHSNVHNYEMVTNPRNTPFFSLHGPQYDSLAKYFDPRRTKTEDILGGTIYQQQVFLNTNEEIPATNDMVFETLISGYEVAQNIDLSPLDLSEVIREDGELTKTFALSPDSSQDGTTAARADNKDNRDEFDDYRDLLIDLLVNKDPSKGKMSNTLKSSSLLKKVLNKPPTPTCDIPNSFVEEKSMLGEKSLPSTPKRTLPPKTSSQLRLATDPNHSFIDEFDRSLQPASTPNLRSKRPGKRKMGSSPKTKTPTKTPTKTDSTKLIITQLGKRQKGTESTVVKQSQNEVTANESVPTSEPTEAINTPHDGSKHSEDTTPATVSTSLPQNTGKQIANGESLTSTGEDTETESVSQPSQIAESNTNAVGQAKPSESESAITGPEERLKPNSTSSNDGVCTIYRDRDIGRTSLGKDNAPAKGSAIESAPVEVSESTASESTAPESAAPESAAPESAASESTAIQDPAHPRTKYKKQLYYRDVSSAKDLLFHSLLRDLSKSETTHVVDGMSERSPGARPSLSKRIELFDECRHSTMRELLKDRGCSSSSSSRGCKERKREKSGRSKLLDASLQSIRQLKGTDHQASSVSPFKSTTLSNETKKSTSSLLDEKVKHLAFKDRAIGQQLTKYCTCWIEDTKHTACVESYGEFLVIINNRYPQQLDMSVVNSALSILSRNMDTLPAAGTVPSSDNFILKTALFTTELLRVLTWNNQNF